MYIFFILNLRNFYLQGHYLRIKIGFDTLFGLPVLHFFISPHSKEIENSYAKHDKGLAK